MVNSIAGEDALTLQTFKMTHLAKRYQNIYGFRILLRTLTAWQRKPLEIRKSKQAPKCLNREMWVKAWLVFFWLTEWVVSEWIRNKLYFRHILCHFSYIFIWILWSNVTAGEIVDMTSKTKDHLNVDQKNIKINIYDESDYINPICRSAMCKMSSHTEIMLWKFLLLKKTTAPKF